MGKKNSSLLAFPDFTQRKKLCQEAMTWPIQPDVFLRSDELCLNVDGKTIYYDLKDDFTNFRGVVAYSTA